MLYESRIYGQHMRFWRCSVNLFLHVFLFSKAKGIKERLLSMELFISLIELAEFGKVNSIVQDSLEMLWFWLHVIVWVEMSLHQKLFS